MASNVTQPQDLASLSSLGKEKATPARKLEAFPNHNPERNYLVTLSTDEFTCVCPATGQPDFAKIRISYIPDQKIVESKSLKLYFWSFRDQGTFHEHVANVILDDLVALLQPRWCEVVADFAVRGGIGIVIRARHGIKPGDCE
ncbi:MAG: preQ(1) synthase [Verrucomicrobiota bacterium]|nr:preQ(1) synthase [Verrucomicrobiota bacterium]